MSDERSGHVLSPEDVQDLVDGRLSESEAARRRAHIEGCAECRAVLAAVETGRKAVRLAKPQREIPADLAAAISTMLDGETVAALPPASGTGSGRWRLPARLAAAAALVLALVWAGSLWRTDDFVAAAADHHEKVTTGAVELTVATALPAVLERSLVAAGAPAVRVLDLAMMGFTLEGGRAHRIGGRPSALYTYRLATGERLVCEMYEGTLDELPPTADTRQSGAFRFHVYQRDTLTLVFWQEGAVVCVLVADLPLEEVVKLAVAKAMAPAA